jgi:hypothetical protein
MNASNNGTDNETQLDAATEKDLEWLHNGFDKAAMKALDELDLERAITATPRPKHWRPVKVERVV